MYDNFIDKNENFELFMILRNPVSCNIIVCFTVFKGEIIFSDLLVFLKI